jgi:hypothetical protein
VAGKKGKEYKVSKYLCAALELFSEQGKQAAPGYVRKASDRWGDATKYLVR